MAAASSQVRRSGQYAVVELTIRITQTHKDNELDSTIVVCGGAVRRPPIAPGLAASLGADYRGLLRSKTRVVRDNLRASSSCVRFCAVCCGLLDGGGMTISSGMRFNGHLFLICRPTLSKRTLEVQKLG